jgi:hypothetical protein
MLPTWRTWVGFYLGVAMLFANGVTIAALTRCKLMMQQMKYLIISLASADLLLGLVLFVGGIRIHYTSLANLSLPVCELWIHFLTFRESVSCFTVVAIAVDRVLVLHYNSRYQMHVTKVKVTLLIASIWLTAVCLPIYNDIYGYRNYTVCSYAQIGAMPLLATVCMGCMIVITVLYVHIYFIVRTHRRHIAAMLPQHMADAANIHFRSSVTSLYFIGAHIIFKCPFYILRILISDSSLRSDATELMLYYLVYWGTLNSLVNPVLYAWRITECRLYATLILFRFNARVTELCRHRLRELV